MSGAIPWKLLQQQYFSDNSYEDELSKLIESPEKVSFSGRSEDWTWWSEELLIVC